MKHVRHALAIVLFAIACVFIILSAILQAVGDRIAITCDWLAPGLAPAIFKWWDNFINGYDHD